METAIVLVAGSGMLAGALVAVLGKKTLTAVIAAGVVSLLASVLYLLLSAPDVAMTEAAIGSGLTTIIFLFVLHRIRSMGLLQEENESLDQERVDGT
ncbi:MAG: DUF4040 domain-containing protein [Candidatus Aminicenantes bacterium]|nr:DUF4040 domain-containing protein [Candidatus Aminicenantes bacterium]